MAYNFNGLGMGMGNLSQLSNAQTRSLSAENFSGLKGQGGMAVKGTGAESARDLGQGWKISPSIIIGPKSTFTLADIQEPGAIQHIWMTTFPSHWRRLILRAYWNGEEYPSIECPIGDFFANGWCELCNINSLPVAVNPAGGMNAKFLMIERVFTHNGGAVIHLQISRYIPCWMECKAKASMSVPTWHGRSTAMAGGAKGK